MVERWKIGGAHLSNNVISIVCLWIELCIYNDVCGKEEVIWPIAIRVDDSHTAFAGFWSLIRGE